MLTETYSNQLSSVMGKELRGRLNNDLVLFALLQESRRDQEDRNRYGGNGPNREPGLTTRQLADDLNIAQSTAATIAKRLKEEDLVTHEKGRAVRLTPAGETVAKERLKHHRLLEVMLCEEFGWSHERAHKESLKLMLLCSCNMIEEINDHYGNPSRCAAGEIIPEVDLCQDHLDYPVAPLH